MGLPIPDAMVLYEEVLHTVTQIFPIIKKTLFLLLLAAIAALVTNHFSPVGIELIGQWDQGKSVINADTKDGSPDHHPDIDDVDMAKLIYDGGKAVFMDARSSDSYGKGHIKGAVSLPVEEFDSMTEFLLNHYPTDKHIITYCSGRSCEDSHRLAQMLFDFGYESVSIMIDGFPVWEESGFPVE
jgi:rhodanese-related sulfurtransferase